MMTPFVGSGHEEGLEVEPKFDLFSTFAPYVGRVTTW
jgi:hypothetical protein